jgi:epoxyqueuosine reductase QueG
VAPSLDELKDLSEEDFAERFRKNPVKRAKLAGLQRNARTAINNSRKEL